MHHSPRHKKPAIITHDNDASVHVMILQRPEPRAPRSADALSPAVVSPASGRGALVSTAAAETGWYDVLGPSNCLSVCVGGGPRSVLADAA